MKTSDNSKCWSESGPVTHRWGEYKVRSIWHFLEKLSIQPSCNTAIILLDIYSRKIKFLLTIISANKHFTSFIHIDKNWKQSKYPLIEEWLSKPQNAHTRKYYSVIKTLLLKYTTCITSGEVWMRNQFKKFMSNKRELNFI